MKEEIQVYIIELLTELERLMPPDENCKHTIIVENGEMSIVFKIGEEFLHITFDDEYMDLAAKDLAKEILDTLVQSEKV